MKNEAIKQHLKNYCEWCTAQGGNCQAKLDGCSIAEALALLRDEPDDKPACYGYYGQTYIVCERCRVKNDCKQDKPTCETCGGSKEVPDSQPKGKCFGHFRMIPCPDCPPKEPDMCDVCDYVSSCTVLPHLRCADKMAVEEPKPDEFVAELREHLLEEKARVKKCIKRDETKHEDFKKQLGDEYSGHVQSSIDWFKEDLAWINKYLKAAARIEQQKMVFDIQVEKSRYLEGVVEQQAQQIAELKAKKEAEQMGPKEIVERIMTQHWDMAACKCWVCKEGRIANCHPIEQHLSYKSKVKVGRVTVEQSEAQDGD